MGARDGLAAGDPRGNPAATSAAAGDVRGNPAASRALEGEARGIPVDRLLLPDTTLRETRGNPADLTALEDVRPYSASTLSMPTLRAMRSRAEAASLLPVARSLFSSSMNVTFWRKKPGSSCRRLGSVMWFKMKRASRLPPCADLRRRWSVMGGGGGIKRGGREEGDRRGGTRDEGGSPGPLTGSCGCRARRG